MKSNFLLILLHSLALLVAWTLVATAERGCGWRNVNRGEEINWDSHILEVKTKEIVSGSRNEDKQLEIFLEAEEKIEDNTLRIRYFRLTLDEKYLSLDILFPGKNISFHTLKPPGELQWIFKKNRNLNAIHMELAGTPLSEYFPIANVEKIDKLKFEAADIISLLYRVNSTSGDGPGDCVEPGNVIQ